MRHSSIDANRLWGTFIDLPCLCHDGNAGLTSVRRVRSRSALCVFGAIAATAEGVLYRLVGHLTRLSDLVCVAVSTVPKQDGVASGDVNT